MSNNGGRICRAVFLMRCWWPSISRKEHKKGNSTQWKFTHDSGTGWCGQGDRMEHSWQQKSCPTGASWLRGGDQEEGPWLVSQSTSRTFAKPDNVADGTHCPFSAVSHIDGSCNLVMCRGLSLKLVRYLNNTGLYMLGYHQVDCQELRVMSWLK